MVNKVILVGRLGKDPEIRNVGEGISVASFPIATDEFYKDRNGERQQKTEWHNIVAWRGLADLSQKYLVKGKQVYVEGKLQTRSYEDKDGNKKYFTEVYAENIRMLGGKNEGSGGYGQERNDEHSQSGAGVAEDIQADGGDTPSDDLPF